LKGFDGAIPKKKRVDKYTAARILPDVQWKTTLSGRGNGMTSNPRCILNDEQKAAVSAAIAAAAEAAKANLRANRMAPDEVPDFVASVFGATLFGSVSGVSPKVGRAAGRGKKRPAPAVPIDQSVTDDAIICLEDGSEHTMMKRYIKRVYGLTPAQYKARWGLDKDYPMTAPSYTRRKRAEAVHVGLGSEANKAGINCHVAVPGEGSAPPKAA
jgi:predicted transcriptional regulator